MDKDEMLDEAIREGFKKLKTKDLGSEEYANGAKSIATLYDVAIKDMGDSDRLTLEEERLRLEKERLKLEQVRNNQDHKWLNKVPWGSIVSGTFMLIGLGLTEKWQADGKLIKLGNLLPKPKL